MCAMHTDTDRIGTPEAARILGCSVWTIYRKVDSKDLTPVARYGRTYVFARSDVEALRNEEQAA